MFVRGHLASYLFGLALVGVGMPVQAVLAQAYPEDTDALIQLMNPHDPQKRVGAAERLGRTGNPKYAEPLSWALLDRNEGVRVSAAGALGQLPEQAALPRLVHALKREKSDRVRKAVMLGMSSFKSEGVDRLLRDAVLDPFYSASVRRHALSLLAGRDPPRFLDFLREARELSDGLLRSDVETLLREKYSVATPIPSPPVEKAREAEAEKSAILEELQAGAPLPSEPQLPSKEEDKRPRQTGRMVVVGSSAAYSASFLELMRRAAESKVSPGWTYPIGLMVGGGTAYLLTHFSQEIEPGKAFWWASSGAWGLTASHFAANATETHRDSGRRIFNLAGEAVGLSIGGLSARRLDWDARDTMFVNVGGTAGSLFGWGLEIWSGSPNDKAKAGALSLIGAAGGLTTAAMTTSRVQLQKRDSATLAFSLGYGAWWGVWGPELIENDPTSTRRTGGTLAGLSAGYATGLYMAHVHSPSQPAVGRSFAGAALGSQFGAGLGFLLYDRFDTEAAAIMQVSGIVGLLTGANYERLFPESRSQPGFKTWIMLSGAYYGALAPGALDLEPKLERKGSGVLVGFPTLIAGVLSVGNAVEMNAKETQGLFLGEGLGGVLGVGGGLMTVSNRQTFSILMMSGGAVGSAVGYRMSHILTTDFTERDKAFITFASFSGSWYGGWTPALLRENEVSAARVFGGILFAGPLSLAVALAAANRYDIQPRTNHGLFLGEVVGGLFGTGLGRAMLTDFRTGVSLMMGGGLLGSVGGYAFARNMAPPSPTRTWREKTLILFGTGSGVWYGSWLARVFRIRDHEVSGDRVLGGGLLGGTTLLTSTLWITNHHDVRPRVLPGLFFGQIFGATLGGGIGLLASSPSQPGADFDTRRRIRREVDRSYYAMMGGGLAGMWGGYQFATRMAEPRPFRGPREIGLYFFSSYAGAWYGAWLPTLSQDRVGRVEERHVYGGMMVGVPTAMATSIWINNHVELEKRTVPGLAVGQALGMSAGTGVSLLFLSDSIGVRTMMLGGGALGTLGGYAFARSMAEPSPFRGPRESAAVVLSGLSGAWYGSWAGSLLPESQVIERSENRRITGGFLTGAPLGVALSTWLVNHNEVSNRDLTGIFGGEAFGWSMGSGLGLMTLSSRRVTTSFMLAGGAVGGLSGFWITRRLPPRAAEEYKPLIALTTASGLWYGAWAPTFTAKTSREVESQRVWGGVLIGGPLGLASGLIMRHQAVSAPGYTGFFLGEFLGSMAGAGAGFAFESPYRTTTAMMLGGGLTLGLAGTKTLPGVSLSKGQKGALAIGGFYGGVYGSLVPFVIEGRRAEVERQQIMGGAMLGVPAGLVLATANFGRWDPPVGSLPFTWLSGIVGSSAGLGMGLVIEDWNSRQVILSMYSTGLSALALGARAAPEVRFSRGAVLFSTFGTLYGFTQGLVLASFSESSARQTGGALLLGSAAGLGTSLILTHDLTVGTGQAAVAYTGGLWGAAIGSMLAQAVESDSEDTSTAAVIVSNAGQIATTYSLLYLQIPPKRMGWINLFGLTGLGLGSAIGLPLSEGGDVFFVSAPVGSLAGLITGAIVTSRWDWEEGSRQESDSKLGSLASRWMRDVSNDTRRGWKTLVPNVDWVLPRFNAIPDPMGAPEDMRYTAGVEVWYH